MRKLLLLLAVALLCTVSFGQNGSEQKIAKEARVITERTVPYESNHSMNAALSENFDGGPGIPAGWETSATNPWLIQDDGSGSNNRAIYDMWNYANGAEGTLTTTSMSITGGDATLTFSVEYYLISGSYGNTGEMYVAVSNDNGATWTESATNTIAGTAGNPAFTYTLDFTAFEGNDYTGDIVKVRLRGVSDYGSYNIALDNFVGPQMPVVNDDVAMVSINTAATIEDGNTDITGTVRNMGNQSNLTSFDVVYTIDGGAPSAVYNVTGQSIAPGATYDFTHNVPYNATMGSHTIEVTISNPNGNTDENAADNVMSKAITVVDVLFTKNVLYEEGTGTWCGWCVRGLVGLNTMAHDITDGTWVGIAVHNGDPMVVTEYNNEIGTFISGYPSGVMDRHTGAVDPGLSTLQTNYNTHRQITPVAKVEINQATWDVATRAITVDVEAIFASDMPSANYNSAVIVVENAVTGTTSGYDQANYYNGGGAGAMTDWDGTNYVTLPNPVPAAQMTYNHVGRALLGGWSGDAGSIPSSVLFNTPYAHTYTHTLPADQDFDNIYFVGIIIDNATGQIENVVEVKATDVIGVPVTTAITTQPTGSTVCEGGNVTFTVVAEGNALTYQWRKGGTDISGANAASYTISGVAVADAGDYTCFVSGTNGTATSNIATLVVNPSTVITGQPSGATLCEGEDVTFTVTATGSNLSYQWKKGAANVGTDNASYTITGVVAADAANYTCVVTGDCGSVTSSVASLVVNTVTAITGHPSGATECVGNDITFTVTATGSNLSYQWKKGAANVGADNASYTITGLSVADAASYTCIVTGDCGTLTSNIATLVVSPTTVITSQPSGATLCEGADITFTITATGSNLSYQWKKGTSNVGTDNASYTLTGITVADAADYTCVVTGDCGNITSNIATLVVNPIPVAASSASATETNICNGESTILSYVGGSGTTFNWYPASSGSSVVASGNNVTLYPTTTTTYYGRWESSCGASSFQTVTVTVDDMPNLSTSATNTNCGASTGTVTVVATGGTGSYTYLWDDISAQNTATATGLGQGVYNVVVTSGACQANGSATVNENGAPNVSVSASLTTICAGETTVLTASGADSYVWTPATDLDATTGAVVNATPTTDITYSVTGTTAGCSASASVDITVGPTTTITGQPMAATECEGAAVTFTVTATGSGLSYQWMKGATNVGTDNPTYTITGVVAADADDYTCVVTGDCGSETSSIATLTISPTIAITSQPAGATECEGADVTFTVQATGSNLSYQWKKGTSNVGTDNPTYTITGVVVADADDYTCVVTGDCGSETTTVATLVVNLYPVADFAIDASAEPIIDFTNLSSGADSYLWDLGDGTTETTTDVSHEYTTNGTFTVVLSATNGCGTVTAQQDVTITNIGIASVENESIKIYPNPAEATINVSLPIENAKIQLINMDGRMLKTIKLKDAKHIEINVEDLATGFYNLVITTENNDPIIVKVVKK